MSQAGLTIRQIRYENKAFWRNPASAFFTFAFPLMFLVIFNLAFGNEEMVIDGRTTVVSTFIIPAIVAFSIITTSYTNIAMSVTFDRDQGLLKRIRGTPLRPTSWLAGRIGFATLVGLLLVAITVTAGALFYNVDVPTNTLPAFIVTLAVGAAAFCALGLAITSVIPNAEAAPAVVNFSILPLLFLSDVFLRLEDPPAWVDAVRNFFPVYHLSQALQTAFNPFVETSGFEWGHLSVVALWGVAGAVLASRYFSWEPRN